MPRGEAGALTERAPAKLNLSLHVLGRRPDGYHALDGLVAFADAFADDLAFTAGGPFRLDVAGPAAADLCPADSETGSGNLVLRAAEALAGRVPGLPTGRFFLVKRLPVAAGLGGGSADAAAALRLLARAAGLAPDDPRLTEVARGLGADVPMCLESRARRVGGIGEVLGEPVRLPALTLLLVRPAVPLPTPQVFAALGLRPGEDVAAAPHPPVASTLDLAAVAALMAATRNDLEAPARRLVPAIGTVLDRITALPGCLGARMSGSGATCFGLFPPTAEVRSLLAAFADLAEAGATVWAGPFGG